ncbi:M3 family metallopeptidase [Cytophagaceae bacterium DM2B3-1]|uniref:M3 family metallopeptidase n=1 Tax=Xanthocytophaga flava TaxID=3048013 RepID=A0ABT7CPS9_9BACT|nr:M3 family metallopeptidase [Xanthocytophaga flavus]MDJ1495749.1 M3 family metallopeptidase [Xanthocytophaga flavus]
MTNIQNTQLEITKNPLLESFQTPHETFPFDRIKNEHYLPALKEAIEAGKKEIDAIVNNPDAPTFENTIAALDQSGSLVDRVSAILFNLNSAETSPELQKIVKDASPLLSEYGNDIRLNAALFDRIKTVYDQRNELNLSAEGKTLLDKTYKGFARNGANLNEDDKARLREIDVKISELSLTFGEHVLNETNAFLLEVDNEEDLAGLPEFVREAAKMAAKEKGKSGWAFTLQAPSYMPFMAYGENRELRRKLAMAYNSRAFLGNENDNREIVKNIVALRHKRAQLLGYESHAHFVLEERMAGAPKKVIHFLDELLEYAKPVAEQQMQELTQYAKTQGFAEEKLQRWDYAFYSEKLKKEKYAIDDEILKPYFKLENVIDGVFKVANKLFGLNFKENKQIPVYHPEVTAYDVTDDNGNFVSVFYADYFPREGKRNGAWMTSYRDQRILNGKDIRPHVSIVCNFTKPTETKPSLLTFGEVTTLFHEFGHALHGMLSKCTYGSTSGTNVYWDFVELPSQIMENWCYEKEALDLFARHYETNEPIPQELIEKIIASANFMEGYGTLRQLSFGMLDMAYHGNAQPISDVAEFERQAILQTSLFPETEGINTSVAFSHIFAGGYSAGYYSYKWAEVLDADAFEYFKEKGIFNRQVADAFRENVLSKGGSEAPMELYKRFRGQEPSPKALLKRSGLLVN